MSYSLDTVVIGAGYSGLGCARDLIDRKRSVVVLEASDRIGGRVYARPSDCKDGFNVELGGGWVNTRLQPLVRREIDRYGIAIKDDVPAQSAVFLTGGELRSLPVPPSEFGDFERAMAHLRDASRRISTLLPIDAQPLRDLDVSADEFFAPLDLPPATRDLIYAMFAMYAGSHPSKASMLCLIGQVAAFGFSPYGFYNALTQRFANGTTSLLKALVEDSGVEVRLSHRVVSVHQDGEGVIVTTAAGDVVKAKTCVIAVPTNVIRHIRFTPRLADAKNDAIATNHVSRDLKVTMVVRNVPPRPVALGMGTLQSIVFCSDRSDGRTVLIGFGTENIIPFDPADKDQVQSALREYFPEAELLELYNHNWNADPNFDGTWRFDPPGKAYDFTRIMNVPEGRVLFAGTDIDNSVWRTWIEGALNSGQWAAQRLGGLLR